MRCAPNAIAVHEHGVYLALVHGDRPAHCAGGGISNGAEPAVDILAARRATHSDDE